jgi:hypothetical protein
VVVATEDGSHGDGKTVKCIISKCGQHGQVLPGSASALGCQLAVARWLTGTAMPTRISPGNQEERTVRFYSMTN